MRILELLAGVVVLFLGAWPYISKISAIEGILGFLGQPGSIIYQGIIIVVGILMVSYANRRPTYR